MRIETSSRKPMIGVRATASMRPMRRGGCGGRSSMTSHLRLSTRCERDLIGALRRHLELHRLDIGIGDALLLGRIEPGIHGGIGAVAGAQPRQRLEARRIDRVGGDVVDRRQLAVLQAEIGGVGEDDGVDQQRQQDRGSCRARRSARSRRRPASPTRIDRPAMPSAPKNVTSAGFISRKPKRTIRIETMTAITEKTARFRDHVARPDTGSDW